MAPRFHPSTIHMMNQWMLANGWSEYTTLRATPGNGRLWCTLWGWRHAMGMETLKTTRPHFYQTRSAWSMDQGSIRKHSAVHNFAPTVTKFCVMWEGLSLPHDTKFGYCGGEIVDRRVIFSWAMIHGSSWSILIKVGPGQWNMRIYSLDLTFTSYISIA